MIRVDVDTHKCKHASMQRLFEGIRAGRWRAFYKRRLAIFMMELS
jgi:hypothetical protein